MKQQKSREKIISSENDVQTELQLMNNHDSSDTETQLIRAGQYMEFLGLLI